MDQLILKRASASRLSGEWNDDDYDVLADGAVVGRIMKAAAAPVAAPWMWTLAFGHHEDRTPIYGYEATREAAMAAFAKSWKRRGSGGRESTVTFVESARCWLVLPCRVDPSVSGVRWRRLLGPLPLRV